MYDNLALSDNGFLFDTRTGATYSLSRTGTFLLRALMAEAERASLPERLADGFDVDHLTAARDVERFLVQLRDMRLVEVAQIEGVR